jgi:hypothetical protein
MRLALIIHLGPNFSQLQPQLSRSCNVNRGVTRAYAEQYEVFAGVCRRAVIVLQTSQRRALHRSACVTQRLLLLRYIFTKYGQAVATLARMYSPRLVIYTRSSLYSCLSSVAPVTHATTTFGMHDILNFSQ